MPSVLQPVHNYVQAKPDHINKVPVPRCAFKRKMMVGSEMAFHYAIQNNRQHNRAHGHVKTVKTRQHEKGGAVNAGCQF